VTDNLKKKIFLVIKLLVSFGLLAYLLLLFDWERTIAILQNVQISKIFFIPLISLVGFVFASLRWILLLSDNDIKFSFITGFWGYWMGLFYSNFLPGVIGSDIIRAGLVVKKKKCSVITSATIVLMERITGIIALFLSMSIILLIMPSTIRGLLSETDTSQLIVFAIMILMGSGVLLLGRSIWPKLLLSFTQKKVVQYIYNLLTTMALIKQETFLISVVLSFLFETMDILTVYFFARAFGFDLPLMLFFAIMPIVYVVTVLPISLGGLGVREGVLVFLLSQTGVPTSDAITLSFMIYINRLFVGGIAGLIQLFINLKGKKEIQTNAQYY
jgi:glycosyltransferase 2 family protein